MRVAGAGHQAICGVCGARTHAVDYREALPGRNARGPRGLGGPAASCDGPGCDGLLAHRQRPLHRRVSHQPGSEHRSELRGRGLRLVGRGLEHDDLRGVELQGFRPAQSAALSHRSALRERRPADPGRDRAWKRRHARERNEHRHRQPRLWNRGDKRGRHRSGSRHWHARCPDHGAEQYGPQCRPRSQHLVGVAHLRQLHGVVGTGVWPGSCDQRQPAGRHGHHRYGGHGHRRSQIEHRTHAPQRHAERATRGRRFGQPVSRWVDESQWRQGTHRDRPQQRRQWLLQRDELSRDPWGNECRQRRHDA